MTDAERRAIAERIESQRVYGLFELQELGIAAADVLQAAADGELARWLGECLHLHVMGVDLADWLCGRPPWPSDNCEARQRSDPTRYRMPRSISAAHVLDRGHRGADAQRGAPDPEGPSQPLDHG